MRNEFVLTGKMDDYLLPAKKLIGTKNQDFIDGKREVFEQYLQVNVFGSFSLGFYHLILSLNGSEEEFFNCSWKIRKNDFSPFSEYFLLFQRQNK